MTARALRVSWCLLFATLVGCADIASLLSTPMPAPVPLASVTPQPSLVISPTSPVQAQARVLRIWLPPRFDPSVESPSNSLLNRRLAEFAATHPGLKIDLRLKAEEGEAGLLNSLAITHLAAPSALPDLIVLPRADLESAARQGLLHPMDGLSTLLDDPNWHPYARELGHVQNIDYGLPFAGNALVLIHPPDLEINTWGDAFASEELMLFPAGDLQAVFPLSLYVSAGGSLVNEQGLPVLEEEPLAQTLSFLQDGLVVGTFSPSLTSLNTDEEIIQAYRDGRSRLVITWAVNHTQITQDVMQPIPGLGASPHTFADGWLWALAGSSPENQQLATELAEFLMDDAFLGEWTRESGFLPTRINAQDEFGAIIQSARALPSQEVLAVLGPIMKEAVSRVLNGEQVPAVVRSVMEEVP